MFDRFWILTASILGYVPFAFLYIVAFRMNLRFSKSITYLILSTITHLIFIDLVHTTSTSAVYQYNYIDMLVIVMFSFATVKTMLGKIFFVGLV